MHVTIVHLTEDKDGPHIGEDAVFEQNEQYFPDGVTEESGNLLKERLDDFVEALGDAVTTGADKRGDGSVVRWIEFDNEKLEPLFSRHHAQFLHEARKLAECTLYDFSTSCGELTRAMHDLTYAYKFDWAYVLSDYGDATPISAWMRAARYKGLPRMQRLYVQAVYDGDQ